MKIPALIIEDELSSSDLLNYLLKKYLPEINVVASVQTVEEAFQIVNENKIELVFLDINLGTDSGFDFLNTSTENIKVIVTSAHKEHALEAINAQVLYYLLKPIIIDDLISAVKLFSKNKALQLTNQEDQKLQINNSSILVVSLDKIDIIKFEELMYIASSGKYSSFILSSGKTIVSSKNIGEYYTKLPSENFFRVHNSYIVNIDFVRFVEKGLNWKCILYNESVIPISRGKRDDVIKALSRT